MKEKPEMKQLVEGITSYRQMLYLFNIRDEQVKNLETNYLLMVVYMIVAFMKWIVCLIFVLPGNLMIFPMSSTVAFYAERERIKALKGSNVKIRGDDVLASIKTLAYISTFPIYLIFFTYMFYLFIVWQYQLPQT